MAGRKNAASGSVIPNGTRVTWHYRSAIGDGTVVGVAKRGTSSATTAYRIRETDHHVSASGSKEPAIVTHYGRALSRSTAPARKTAGGRKR